MSTGRSLSRPSSALQEAAAIKSALEKAVLAEVRVVAASDWWAVGALHVSNIFGLHELLFSGTAAEFGGRMEGRSHGGFSATTAASVRPSKSCDAISSVVSSTGHRPWKPQRHTGLRTGYHESERLL